MWNKKAWIFGLALMASLHAFGQSPPPELVPTGPLRSLAVSPDGKFLVAGGFGDFLEVWEVATQEKVAQIKFGYTPIFSIVFLSNRTLIAASNLPPVRIRLDDSTAGSLRWVTEHVYEMKSPHRSGKSHESLALSLDGRLIAGCGLRDMGLWSTATNTVTYKHELTENWFHRVAFPENEEPVVFASTGHSTGGNHLYRYRFDGGKMELEGQYKLPAYGFEGEFVVPPFEDSLLILTNENSRSYLLTVDPSDFELSRHQRLVWGFERAEQIEFSPSGQYVALIGRKYLSLLDRLSEKWLGGIKLKEARYERLATFTPDESVVFVGGGPTIERFNLTPYLTEMTSEQKWTEQTLEALWDNLDTDTPVKLAYLAQQEWVRRGPEVLPFLAQKISVDSKNIRNMRALHIVRKLLPHPVAERIIAASQVKVAEKMLRKFRTALQRD